MTHKRHSYKKLARDLFFVIASIVVAIILVQVGVFQSIVLTSKTSHYIASFVAGLFFTSAFTIAPASVVLAHISETASPIMVAFFGAIGAMIGDYIIFSFVRDALAEDIQLLIRGPVYKKIVWIFKFRIFRRFVPLLGALIIASPLPDELGLAMMGLSHMSTRAMLPLTFVMNFFGVLLVAWFAGTL